MQWAEFELALNSIHDKVAEAINCLDEYFDEDLWFYRVPENDIDMEFKGSCILTYTFQVYEEGFYFFRGRMVSLGFDVPDDVTDTQAEAYYEELSHMWRHFIRILKIERRAPQLALAS